MATKEEKPTIVYRYVYMGEGMEERRSLSSSSFDIKQVEQ